MIKKIIRFSVKNKAIVFFFTFLTIFYGIYSFVQLPIDAVPDITNNQVQVNTTATGWTAEEIEKMITAPLELSLRGISGTTEIRSHSRLGLSQITVIFRDDVDIYRARQMVAERLQDARDSIPEGVTPRLGPISTGLGEVFQYVVEFKEIADKQEARFKQLVELRTIQEWLIKPRLAGLKGVAEINTIGGFERQMHIVPNPLKLAKYGMSFVDIENAVKGAMQNIGGGYIEQEAEQFAVQAIGFLKTPEDVLSLPIKKMANFDVVKIGDVADVVEGKEFRYGSATYNGREAVVGTILMMTGENSRIVAELAEKRIAEISRDLPSNIKIIPVYSRSDLVNATIDTVWKNITFGCILVIVILFLLIGNVRAALITAFTIPLALIITIIGMRSFGISGNLMSLGALDFGIIIDAVVIVVDHCMRKLAGKNGDPDEIVIEAATEIRRVAGFGQFIVLIVFLPIFAFVGIEAKTFQPMAATFIIALLGALILSFTVAPALVALLLRRNFNTKESVIMLFLEAKYIKLVNLVINQSGKVIFVSVVIVAISIAMFTRLGAEFMPQLKEGTLAFHLIMPQNASLTMSEDMTQKAEKIMLEFPEVERVFSRIGTAEVANHVMGVNVADTYILLKDFGHGVDFDELTEKMLTRLKNDLPGITYLASQPIQMLFNELLEGARADLTIKIFGSDLNKLQIIGEKIEEIVKPLSKESDVELDRTSNFPVFTIEPNMQELQRYGINKSAVLEQVSLSLSGREVGYFFDNDRRFPILVRLSDEHRTDLEVIKKLPIPIFSDTTVPLSSIAGMEFKHTSASINRDNGYRRATIMANIRGMDTNTFVKRAQAAVAENVAIVPEGYFIEWGGQFKNLKEANLRLLILVPLTLIIVFFMIYMAFGNALQACLVFIGIPFALCGGIMGLYIVGLPLSISAAVGFIALVGITVVSSIILVNGFNTASGLLKEKVINGSVLRLRAVLMTGATDILGFIPMAIATSVGAEVQRPLAIVIIFGVATSLLATLILVPAVYYRIYSKVP